MSRDTEDFWRGRFGAEYNERNRGRVDSNVAFFSRALQWATHPIRRVLELGCGTGQNLEAIRRLNSVAELTGVEVNDEAAVEAAHTGAHIYRRAIADWSSEGKQWDLVFTKGVLIHIPPEELPAVYAKMFAASWRYILVAEYFSPQPVEVPYRGHSGRLWKRDFATEILGEFPSLRVLSYGFVWRNDYHAPQDDLTWFLMEKTK